MGVTIYRRHSSGCHHEADRCFEQCRWRLWFPHSSDAGETIRVSATTRSWESANRLHGRKLRTLRLRQILFCREGHHPCEGRGRFRLCLDHGKSRTTRFAECGLRLYQMAGLIAEARRPAACLAAAPISARPAVRRQLGSVGKTRAESDTVAQRRSKLPSSRSV